MTTRAPGAPRLPDAVRDVLADARAVGFLGPGPLEPHLAHALAFARVVSRVGGGDWGDPAAGGARVGETRHGGADERAVGPFGLKVPASLLDLGSGGGLPGLVLAAVWPATSVTLVDSQQRRTAFLADAAQRLEVSTRLEVLTGRAESIGHDPKLRGRYDVVVARSFARPAVTAECGAPFLRIGGILVVSEPPAQSASEPRRSLASEGDETRWPETGLGLLGMGPACPVHDEFHFVAMRQQEDCPERFARRVGLPAKRPLF